MSYYLLLLSLLLTLAATIENNTLSDSTVYCPGRNIQGKVKNLIPLLKCDVIEGNLVISLNVDTEDNWKRLGGLKVKEITGYLMLFHIEGLTSLDLVFPNLTVIRGDTLHENYALVIYEVLDLEVVMLYNLKSILRGSVKIYGNPKLSSNAHKVSWSQIAKNADHNAIASLQLDVHCSSICDGGCWSLDKCQEVNDETNCHEQCAGGCSRPNDTTACFACKGVRDGDACFSKCRMSLYELDNYRCVTERQCMNIEGRKLLEDEGQMKCVETCPSHREDKLVGETMTIRKCVKCEDPCLKNCTGGLVDSIAAAQRFKDCVIVEGSVEIRLVIAGEKLTNELEINLGQIKVINGFLHIFECIYLKNINFFKNLEEIKGVELFPGNYSLAVINNANLQALWNSPRNLRLGDANNTVFYWNPALCPDKIKAALDKEIWKNIYPGLELLDLLNGNEEICNVDNMIVSASPVAQKGTINVTITMPSKTHKDLRKLAGFQIYYREWQNSTSPFSNSKPWLFRKVNYNNDDPHHVTEMVEGLKAATRYEVYVKSIGTERLVNNFQSMITNVTTSPYNPTKPGDIIVSERHKDWLKIRWSKPAVPNGEIDHYIIRISPWKKRGARNDEDYCAQGHGKPLQASTHNYYGRKKEANSSLDEVKQTVSTKMQTTKDFNDISQQLIEYKFHDGLVYITTNEKAPSRKRRSDRSIAVAEGLSPKTGNSFNPITEKTSHLAMGYASSLPLHVQTNTVGSVTEEPGERWRMMKIMETVPEFRKYLSFFADDFLSDHEINTLINATDIYIEMQFTTGSKEAEMHYTLGLSEEGKQYSGDVPVYRESSIPEGYNISRKEELKVTNLTEPYYMVEVWACQKEITECPSNLTPPCKLCSKIPSTKTAEILPKEGEKKVRNVSAKVEENIVHISWEPPLYRGADILAYEIVTWKRTGQSNEYQSQIRRCLNAFSRNASIEIGNPGNYNITVTAVARKHYKGSLSSTESDIMTFHIAEKKIHSKDKGVFALVILFPIFAFVFVYFARKILKIKFLKLDDNLPKLSTSHNPHYGNNQNCEENQLMRHLRKIINSIYLYDGASLQIGFRLGNGNFGFVWDGTLTLENGIKKRVAVKTLKASNGGGSNEDLIDEADFMINNQSHHLVKIFGLVVKNDELFLVMELMTGGSLDKYLKKRREDCKSILEVFSIHILLKFAIQIADGMAYLESKNLIHRDLAARNCLFDKETFNFKVCDFGMARCIGSGEFYRMGKRHVPLRRMPPEYFDNGIFTCKSDVWSYGVLIWEVLNLGKTPYWPIDDLEIGAHLQQNGNTLKNSLPLCTPYFLVSLMNSCLDIDMNNRPTFESIVKDELLNYVIDQSFSNEFSVNSHCFNQDESVYVHIGSENGPDTPLTKSHLQFSHKEPDVIPEQPRLEHSNSLLNLWNSLCSLPKGVSYSKMFPFMAYSKRTRQV